MIKFRPDPGQIGLPECNQAGFPSLHHGSYRDIGFVQNNRQVVVTTICHSGLKLNYYQAQWDNDMVFEIPPFDWDDNPVGELESGPGAAKIWSRAKYSKAAPAPDHSCNHFVILTERHRRKDLLSERILLKGITDFPGRSQFCQRTGIFDYTNNTFL